jgi:hypothetical protein
MLLTAWKTTYGAMYEQRILAGWLASRPQVATLGKTFVGLLVTEKLTPLNDTMKTNEESTNGEFDVDCGNYFKKQAANLDVTIFEETE